MCMATWLPWLENKTDQVIWHSNITQLWSLLSVAQTWHNPQRLSCAFFLHIIADQYWAVLLSTTLESDKDQILDEISSLFLPILGINFFRVSLFFIISPDHYSVFVMDAVTIALQFISLHVFRKVYSYATHSGPLQMSVNLFMPICCF